MDVEEIKTFKKKCILHAKDLVRGSKLLLKDNLANLAYHLAVLALEEVGKSAMVMMSRAAVDKEKGLRLLKKTEEDHEKKIFYALWLPSLGKEKCTPQQVQAYQNMANNIHLQRLKGLYVDPGDVDKENPGLAVSPDDAEKMVSLVEARINMEECYEIREPDEKTKGDLDWFGQATLEDEKRKLIFGQKSLDKLNEFDGDSGKWIAWMKEQFDQADKESLEMANRELARKEPGKEEKINPKWRVKVRLFTLSHSIRQSVLDQFNKKIPNLKFMVAQRGKVSDLIIEKILPLGVSIHALWYAAWGDIRLFVISLNIASRGYFWWYVPKDVAKFYESIVDLDTGSEVQVERRPKLELNWGGRVLTEADLINTIMCYRFLPRDNVDFLGNYTTGISFFGKNDIHTPFEKEIFLQFYHALINAMRFYKDLTTEEDIAEAAAKIINALGGESVVETAKNFIKMANNLMVGHDEKITLTECGGMKLLCDYYITKKVLELAEKEQMKINESVKVKNA